MSYLPRMSKTYKEPQQQDFKEPEENTSMNTLKPASSLLNEKVYNPQTILKHYRYHPHPLPVLPGPSVTEEAMENERFRELSRLRRSASKMENFSKASEKVAETPVEADQNEDTMYENESVTEENLKVSSSKKVMKKSKSSLGRRKSAKHLKREEGSKVAINMCLLKTELTFPPSNPEKTARSMIGDFDFLKRTENTQKTEKPKSAIPDPAKTETKPKNLTDLPKNEPKESEPKNIIDRSTQCAIVGNFSKSFVIPPVINSLLRTLSFLLHEIAKETINKFGKEKKSILIQSQSVLEILCEKIDREYSFEITYSDFKRLEKILGELKKYLRDIYGERSEYIDKMEDLKRIFIELRKKEMELFDLGEKLAEVEDYQKDITVNEKDLKSPEVTIQNNRLESEQLMAEVEFSLMELRNYQKTLAELDWDIKNSHKKMYNLKKSASSTKTEIVGRKCSRKLSSEMLSKGINIESEISKKKT